MAKRIATAILMCAVMALVAFVPLVAAGEHTIIKGPQGPRASAMTWTYEPTDYGVWNAELNNNGLRSLVIDVYENTSGALDLLLHQRIRFAAYGIYPTGSMLSEPVNMAAGRTYEITATPNGPKDSSVVVTDKLTVNAWPIADFTAATDQLTVNVDATASYDPDGTIAEYNWEWGDGSMGAGMVTSHTYAMDGTYDVILTVVDNVGGTGSMLQQVTVSTPPPVDTPPVASFTATVDGLTVVVDASASSDDKGIVSYAWSWGDGMTDVGVTATHTYVPPVALSAMSESSISISATPVPPYYAAGYTYDTLGNIMPDCQLTITDMRTGEWIAATSDASGFYMVDVANAYVTPFAVGDLIKVDAVKGLATGSNEAVALAGGYVVIDVVLTAPEPVTFTREITLTVTDTIGQTATMSLMVTLSYYP